MIKLFDRINVFFILKEHYNTFYDYSVLKATGEKKATRVDFICFFIIPIVFTILLGFFRIRLVDSYISIIITALSICVGLLFNLLTLILDLARKQKIDIEDKEVKKVILSEADKVKFILTKELFVNIASAIVISIVAIAFSLLMIIKPKFLIALLMNIRCYESIKELYFILTSMIVIFLVIEFFLLLLMILKRFFLIFNQEIKQGK